MFESYRGRNVAGEDDRAPACRLVPQLSEVGKNDPKPVSYNISYAPNLFTNLVLREDVTFLVLTKMFTDLVPK